MNNTKYYNFIRSLGGKIIQILVEVAQMGVVGHPNAEAAAACCMTEVSDNSDLNRITTTHQLLMVAGDVRTRAR